jgi:AcrR family transcriptional regulator
VRLFSSLDERYQRPRQRHRPDEKRERAVEAARTVFAARGYGSTTIHEICRIAGIGVGTFYAQFESKPEVMGAVIENEHEQHLAAIDAVAQTGRRDSFFARYLAARDTRLLAAIREAAAVDRPVRSTYERVLGEARARLADAIERQRASARTRSMVSARTVAWFALSLAGTVGGDGPDEAAVAEALSVLTFGDA